VPDWQERIHRHTEPAIRVEHDARYRLAAPLIASAGLWCDLGCGHGIAAAAALRAHDGFSGRAVLVDLEEDTARLAAEELGAADAIVIGTDLATPEGVARVTEHLGDGSVVTCFEVIEHLATFAPLVERLVELEPRVTTILSVPNDAFWAIHNPHHQTMWGEGAFAELETLLPERRTLLHQLQLAGSALVPAETEQTLAPLAEVQTHDAVPTHFIAAFGPRAQELAPLASIAQVDLDEQRRWVRQRESDNALVNDLVRVNDEFRAYIAELEARLAGRES
jgi:2-polyprenyl-3-methyl-5-hydroxy-6-metoxy-1,4-benzoquinol methylase